METRLPEVLNILSNYQNHLMVYVSELDHNFIEEPGK